MIALQAMWKLITAMPALYFLDVVLWTTVHTLPLLPALLLRQTLDRVFANTGSPLSDFATAMLVYTVVRIIIITAGAVTDAVHRFHVSSILRYNVVREILRRPGAAALSTSPGEALDSIRDDAEHLHDTVSWVADFFGELVFAVVAIGIMLSINPRVTAVVFLPLIAVGVLYNVASQGLEKYRAATRQAAATVTEVLGEMFTAIQSLQMAQAETQVAARLRSLNTTRASLALRERKFNHSLDFLSNSTVGIGSAAILWVAGRELGGGEFTVGDFALFVSYLEYVTDIAGFYGAFVANVQQGKVAVKRLLAMCGEELSVLVAKEPWLRPGDTPVLPRQPLNTFEVRNLSCSYPNGGIGINDASFSIERNQLVAVTGRIGSGKTTLLRAVLGQLPTQRGEILWNGTPLDLGVPGLPPPWAAYVRQSPLLFSGTLRENLCLGGDTGDDELLSALRQAVFSTDLDSLPAGLDTVVGVRGVKLSGGQVQRVATARAIIQRPELLVFDDLSSALDVKTEDELWHNLIDSANPATYLVVTHRAQVLRRADKIIVLREGRIVDQGRYEELLLRCPEFRSLQE